jgi:anti-sigma regulatory factor (Ser/Thr protein kinase)
MAINRFLLPDTADGTTLFGESEHWRLEHASNTDDRLELDFSRLRFILPTGVTFLSNLIHWLESRGWALNFVNHLDRSSEAIIYLDDAGFFLAHEGMQVSPHAKIRPTTLALERIKAASGHSWLRTKFIPWLAPTLGLGEASLYPFETSIQEVITNISDHSGRDAGSIFVQHYPSKKEVAISIADFGAGIPNTSCPARLQFQANSAATRCGLGLLDRDCGEGKWRTNKRVLWLRSCRILFGSRSPNSVKSLERRLLPWHHIRHNPEN